METVGTHDKGSVLAMKAVMQYLSQEDSGST